MSTTIAPLIAPAQRTWTADDFEQACEAGVFGRDVRVELVHGRIIEQMPVSPLHANLAEYLADCLRAVLPRDLKVREEKPVRLAFDDELIPDVSVARGRLGDMHQPHPLPYDLALLVEVAITSAEYDLGEKALLYARAGIQDYWVALPEREQVVVHREPGADGYARVTAHGADGAASPLAAPGVTLAVRDLLGLPGDRGRRRPVTTLTATDMAAAQPPDFLWTADRFYRAAAAGVFDDPGRLELIHGRLVERMPQGEWHVKLRRRAGRHLRERLEPALAVCEECPLHIAFDGEPVPDILVTRQDEYEGRHPEPGDVALLVEVADSSRDYDLGGKAVLYAQAGVEDYWVIVAGRNNVIVHREPTLEGYASVVTLGLEGFVSPLAATDVTLPVRDLLGLPAGEK